MKMFFHKRIFINVVKAKIETRETFQLCREKCSLISNNAKILFRKSGGNLFMNYGLFCWKKWRFVYLRFYIFFHYFFFYKSSNSLTVNSVYSSIKWSIISFNISFIPINIIQKKPYTLIFIFILYHTPQIEVCQISAT